VRTLGPDLRSCPDYSPQPGQQDECQASEVTKSTHLSRTGGSAASLAAGSSGIFRGVSSNSSRRATSHLKLEHPTCAVVDVFSVSSSITGNVAWGFEL
jgi:hypothetical protein